MAAARSIPRPPPILITVSILYGPFIKSDRVQPGKVQPDSFVPAQRCVERLHSVASRAFHQIIERGHNHNTPRTRLNLEADVAVIAADQHLWLRIAINAGALFDNADIWFGAIRRAIELPEIAIGEALAQERLGRDKDAAHQFYCGG